MHIQKQKAISFSWIRRGKQESSRERNDQEQEYGFREDGIAPAGFLNHALYLHLR